jgi:hypothetical protein
MTFFALSNCGRFVTDCAGQGWFEEGSGKQAGWPRRRDFSFEKWKGARQTITAPLCYLILSAA